MTLKPRTGLVCTDIKRATKIKKLLKQEQTSNFLFDCRDHKNIIDHLQANEIDVLVIDYRNALIMKEQLNEVAKLQPKIVLIWEEKDHTFLIPTCFYMFSIVAVSDGENELKLAVDSAFIGAHFFSSTLSINLKKARAFLSAPSVVGISKIQIDVLNAYLEGGTTEEMAKKTNMSGSTFKKHLQRIKSKLNLDTNNEVIDFLRKHHWCNFESGRLIWF